MIVVADAGPLIHLSAIGQLNLLHLLFGQVLVPDAVYQEVVVVGAGLPGAAEVEAAEWINFVPTSRTDVIEALLAGGLHLGECEAIALSVEKNADYLLIDERQGRLSATAMGLPIIGTVGVLVAAKTRGEIDAIAPLLNMMQSTGFWISNELLARVLASVGEE